MGGDGFNGVTAMKADACDKCREDIMKQLAGLWEQSDKFASAITELKVISATQMTILSQTNKILENQVTRQDRQEERTDRIVERAASSKVPEERSWKQPWFKYIIITLCVITVVIVGAAIGINALKEWAEVAKGG